MEGMATHGGVRKFSHSIFIEPQTYSKLLLPRALKVEFNFLATRGKVPK